MAETRRLDDPSLGTHFSKLTPVIDAGCRSITLTANPRAKVAGTSRGNVRTIAPTSTAIDSSKLRVDGSDLKQGATVLASFSNAADASRALVVLQHYRIDEKLSIGSFDYFLASGAPPSGTLAGSSERKLDPALYQVGSNVTRTGGWVIVEAAGNQVNLIHDFGPNRDQAYSAVEEMRRHGFNREVGIPSLNKASLRYFRRD